MLMTTKQSAHSNIWRRVAR